MFIFISDRSSMLTPFSAIKNWTGPVQGQRVGGTVFPHVVPEQSQLRSLLGSRDEDDDGNANDDDDDNNKNDDDDDNADGNADNADLSLPEDSSAGLGPDGRPNPWEDCVPSVTDV